METEKTAAERRKELATLLFCQSYLYYHDMLSSADLRGYVKGYRPFRISTESLSRGSRSTVWKLNTKINYEKTRKKQAQHASIATWYVVDKLTRYPNAFCKLTGKD